MEILKESDFRKEIKAAPRSGYLLFGEEDYLKSFAVKTAREVICPDETFAFFNVMKLDALDFTPAKLIDALMPMPMGADRKLVTVTGLNFNTMRPNETDALCAALEALKEDMSLIILTHDYRIEGAEIKYFVINTPSKLEFEIRPIWVFDSKVKIEVVDEAGETVYEINPENFYVDAVTSEVLR